MWDKLVDAAIKASIDMGAGYAANAALGPDQARSAGMNSAQLLGGPSQMQAPEALSNGEGGAANAMQAYLTQLAQTAGRSTPSMRARPRAAVSQGAMSAGGPPVTRSQSPAPAAAPAAAPAGMPPGMPSGIGAGVPKNGMPGMGDLAGMLQSLYAQMSQYGGQT